MQLTVTRHAQRPFVKTLPDHLHSLPNPTRRPVIDTIAPPRHALKS